MYTENGLPVLCDWQGTGIASKAPKNAADINLMALLEQAERGGLRPWTGGHAIYGQSTAGGVCAVRRSCCRFGGLTIEVGGAGAGAFDYNRFAVSNLISIRVGDIHFADESLSHPIVWGNISPRRIVMFVKDLVSVVVAV